MGRDALRDGTPRVVGDHRTRLGWRVTGYMRTLVEPFVPKPWPFAPQNGDEGKAASTKPPAVVREMARTAGRLLLEEEQLLVEIAKPHKSPAARRLKRQLLGVRAMRIKIEKLLQERAKDARRGF